MVDFAKAFNINVNVPPVVFSLVSAGIVFFVLYWILNKYAWKWPFITKLLSIPDLSGSWTCQGESLNADGAVNYLWKGEIIVIQTWDKLRIRLKSPQSGSNSVAAALATDPADGFVLLYQYENDPNVGEPNLSSHIGCAVVTIDKNLTSATGEYFNGRRSTYGKMTWTKNL